MAPRKDRAKKRVSATRPWVFADVGDARAKPRRYLNSRPSSRPVTRTASFGSTTCCVREERVPLGSDWAAAPETLILRLPAGAQAVSARSRLRGRLPPRRAVS
jgi:hypothetical protein